VLAVRGLVVRFGDHVAVDGVDLDVAAGEIVCVLGPSGSGKSSLLRAVAGLEAAAAGAVALGGHDITAVAAHERGVGFVFQDFALFPHRDVADNVAFGLRMQGRRDDGRVAAALGLVGLPGYERRDIATLSGGEAQRVALARALAPQPAVLLLDEPLGSLDRPLRERLTRELRALLHDLDVAVVHVTHDQHEALAIADRVVVLRDGRIAQAGTPVEVWRAPADEWVARFLGFANVLAAGEGRVRVVPPDAVHLAPGGDPATVLSVAFTGGGFAVEVRRDDGTTLTVPVAADGVPAVGARVGVVVDLMRTSVVPAVP
jgi:thiamine transport system ATP-binding protein